ncbi:YfhH family protein [Niallia sp. NCCP-28]|uniref:YfhH family protein n=1 Tax=Niallia sp. NCCP-28 TaxID=2934712 RepID=UPI0020856A0B|nr:YfhH family protein [Niallia sp. NCCP-28]GKU85240.1 transcriptional regulator [Niallia sp. NCCP-28]
MLTKRYSEMAEYELRMEIASLNEKAKKAEQLGMVNEFAVLERKAVLAKAYLLNPNEIKINEFYEIEGDPGVLFRVDYLNGVFAWGFRNQKDSKEEGIPISLLKKSK